MDRNFALVMRTVRGSVGLRSLVSSKYSRVSFTLYDGDSQSNWWFLGIPFVPKASVYTASMVVTLPIATCL